jgi:hypothetical protein
MGSDHVPEQGRYVDQLAQHARKLQREARAALARGDYARAAALIGDAEMLAEDVHGLVDDIEQRQSDAFAQPEGAPDEPAAQGRRRLSVARRYKLGAALAAGLAISLALVECSSHPAAQPCDQFVTSAE